LATTYRSLARSLVLLSRESAFLYEERLQDILLKDFPLESPKELGNFLKSTIDLIDAHLENLQKQVEVETSEALAETNQYEDIFDSAQIYSQLIRVLQGTLPLMERCCREHTPQTAVFFVRELTRGLNLKAHFFLTAIPELTYAYQHVTAHLHRILDSVVGPERLPQDDIVALLFPETHRTDVLLHSLLAHEIGHWINEEKGIVKKMMPRMIPKPETLTQIREEFERQFRGTAVESEISSFVSEKVITQSKHWLTEVVSDLIGIRLLGPAFVFGLVEFMLRHEGPDSASPRYPSARARATILIQELEALDYLASIRKLEEDSTLREPAAEFMELLMTLKRYVTESTPSPGPSGALASRLNTVVSDLIFTLLPDLKREVKKAMGDVGYTSTEFLDDLPALISRLSALVPPCEIQVGESAKIGSIVNSGVFFLKTSCIDGLMEHLEESDTLRARARVSALTSKAIELAVVQQMLRPAKKEPSK
jgi:hypothetical protein